VQFNWVKNCTKNWTEYSLAQHRFLIRFVSSVCLLVRVTMVDKNKAVVCCLLATLAIMLSEKKKRKRKMWSKKRYLKRNTYHAMLICWMNWVAWDGAIVVSAGKLRKLWDSLNELRSPRCERRLESTFLRPALLLVKTAQFTQFFRQVWRHTVKSLSLTEGIGRLTLHACGQRDVSAGNILVLCSGCPKFWFLPGQPTPCFRFVVHSFQSVQTNAGVET
jgi:hypothetical protein